MTRSFLIRYGLERRTGWFTADEPGMAPGPCVGLDAVIRTRRGLELGRILLESSRPEADDGSPPPTPGGPGRLLRLAGAEDLEMAETLDRDRAGRFEACRAVLAEGVWPIELVDAEPLLDGNRTVLHYLGPHHLEAAGLRDAFLVRCGLDVWLEAVGADVNAEDEREDDHQPDDDSHGCGSCGSSGGGGCGSSGGEGGCGTGGGCGSCGVKDLIAAKARPAGVGR
ncbi:hypothetical protein EP7_002763 [Isosphaeraceae bacterium EP7]